jgi:hypothetical protein
VGVDVSVEVARVCVCRCVCLIDGVAGKVETRLVAVRASSVAATLAVPSDSCEKESRWTTFYKLCDDDLNMIRWITSRCDCAIKEASRSDASESTSELIRTDVDLNCRHD